jgi:hypothetical protein
VAPRAGLDDVDKSKFFTLPGLELRHIFHPSRSQSLYRLRYSGSVVEHNIVWYFYSIRKSVGFDVLTAVVTKFYLMGYNSV